ncbi:hypothetical protein GQ44DRAFT_730006 [Phaeosphaeriaceae sp. PMI808]|nr:hypothetical protein GQ44DRAFT_730006 [Phaeosphaeriaceae sp. PMI808]
MLKPSVFGLTNSRSRLAPIILPSQDDRLGLVSGGVWYTEATGETALSIKELSSSAGPSDVNDSVEVEDDPDELLDKLPDETVILRKRAGTESLGRVRRTKKSTSTNRLGSYLGDISNRLKSLAVAVQNNKTNRALAILQANFKVLLYKLLVAIVDLFADEFTSQKFTFLSPEYRKN